MVPERIYFSKTVRLAKWNSTNGHCEKCGAKLMYGHYQWHHIKEVTYGGDASLANCMLICTACHSKITKGRAPVIAKSNRMRNKHIGIRAYRKPMIGSRDSGWKKTFNNGWIRR